jgi:hypothetical protein
MRERSKVIFTKKFKVKLSFILFLCFWPCSFIFDISKTFATLEFVHPMTQKLLNWLKMRKNWKMFNRSIGWRWEKYWKMFDDKYMFTDGQFTLVLWEMDFGSVIELTDSLKKFKQNNRFSMTQFSLEILWISPNVISISSHY